MSDATRSVRLSAVQSDYLRQAEYLPPRLREVVDAASVDLGLSGLAVSGEIADALQSALTDRLARVGFDANYDLTKEGSTLEDLIDLFGVEPV